MKIVILEDNHGRRAAMEDCLRDRFHQHEVVFFGDASMMCKFLDQDLASVLLIDLDHDLELEPTKNGPSKDPGTGREVADFLAARQPVCPVIVHTTNSAAGDGMEFLLCEAGWSVHRVHPYGDTEWIATSWFRAVRNAIVAAALPREKTR
jgi:CheY-like chemotaxis protein